jgi:HK97 family phage portal protein
VSVDDALTRAFAQADPMTHLFRSKAASAVGDVMAGGPTGFLSETPQLGIAREQERHFIGWVYAAIRPIAQRIAARPVRVARRVREPQRAKMPAKHMLPAYLKDMREGLELMTAHPIVEAIDNPNDWMVRSTLLLNTVASLELTGRAFWWLVWEGKRHTIYPVPASWVEPKHDGGNLFNRYIIRPRFTGSAVEYTVAGEDMVRFYYPDPSNPIRGSYSPLQAAARAVTTDESIQECQRQLFNNGVWPGLALIVGRHPDARAPGVPNQRPMLTKEQRAQLITAVKQAYRGVWNYGEPLVLDALIEDVKKISNAVAEMDFKESCEITKGRIFQSFGVNPIVVGENIDANRAVAATADALFCSATVNPKIEILSQWMTKELPPRFDDPDVVVWLEEARPSDPEETRAEMDLLGKYGSITVNELRSVFGFPPVDGPAGDQLIQPRPAGGGAMSVDGGVAKAFAGLEVFQGAEYFLNLINQAARDEELHQIEESVRESIRAVAREAHARALLEGRRNGAARR